MSIDNTPDSLGQPAGHSSFRLVRRGYEPTEVDQRITDLMKQAGASQQRIVELTGRVHELETAQALAADAPGPTAARGSAPQSAATTAAADVVFPMPMSPTHTRSAPPAMTARAASAPAASAAPAWAGLIAGPSSMSGDALTAWPAR